MKYGAARHRRPKPHVVPPPTRGQLERMRDTYSGAVEAGILPRIEPVDAGPPSATSQQLPAPAIALGTLDVVVGRAWKALIAKLRSTLALRSDQR